MDKVILCAIGFLLLFSTFFTASGLAGKVLADNDFGNLGFYSLGLLYIVFAMCCFFATKIVKKCGARFSLVGGSLCYSFYISTFILSSYRTYHLDSDAWYLNKTFIILLVYFAAAVNGFGASILWVAEGQYVSMCANDKNKGLFNSTFWAIFMSSNIVGYLMSAFVIGAVKKQYVFFIIVTGICICSSLFFLLLSNPTPHPV